MVLIAVLIRITCLRAMIHRLVGGSGQYAVQLLRVQTDGDAPSSPYEEIEDDKDDEPIITPSSAGRVNIEAIQLRPLPDGPVRQQPDRQSVHEYLQLLQEQQYENIHLTQHQDSSQQYQEMAPLSQ